ALLLAYSSSPNGRPFILTIAVPPVIAELLSLLAELSARWLVAWPSAACPPCGVDVWDAEVAGAGGVGGVGGQGRVEPRELAFVAPDAPLPCPSSGGRPESMLSSEDTRLLLLPSHPVHTPPLSQYDRYCEADQPLDM
ncbi:MAG: hypothetical protein ACXVA4_10185, partial [Ktedonobacterales bacterium]